MSLLESIMSRQLVLAEPEESVAAATDRLSRHEVGALLVVQEGRLRGILSERDVLRRVLAMGLDPAQTLVGGVATSQPVSVPPDAPLEECLAVIRRHDFRHLPVTTADGTVVGILSSRDLLRFAVDGLEKAVERLRAEAHREEMTDPFDCRVA